MYYTGLSKSIALLCMTYHIVYMLIAVTDILNITKNDFVKVSKGAKIRNRFNQVSHLTQDTNDRTLGKIIF